MDKIKNNNSNTTNNLDSEGIYVSLGFNEKPNNTDFNHNKFPSKIGGNPIWLYPIEPGSLLCDFCGAKMTYLLQVYAYVDNIQHCFHRTLYLFFCMKCYKVRQAFKCIRLQLKEKSEFYEGTKVKDLKRLPGFNIETSHVLKPDYTIHIYDEKVEASRIFTKFINEIHLKDKEDNFFEELIESDPQLSKEDNLLVKKLVNEYNDLDIIDEADENADEEFQNGENSNNTIIKDLEDKLEDEFLTKVSNPIFKPDDDIFFKFFTEVIKYDPDQIIRYCRDESIHPMWFCKNNIITSKSFNCKYCSKNLCFEFQVMPALFLLYEELLNHDIGTIVVYTCDCDFSDEKNVKNNFNINYSEEYVYLQRTGEKLIDLSKKEKENLDKLKKQDYNIIKEKSKENILKSKVLVKGNIDNTPDEHGFITVQKKKKNNKKLQNM